jgi:hypothetical protein
MRVCLIFDCSPRSLNAEPSFAERWTTPHGGQLDCARVSRGVSSTGRYVPTLTAGERGEGGVAMITADVARENVWAAARALCNDLMSLDTRAGREGWTNLGGAIADGAVEVLAELSSGCGQVDCSATRLRALSALRGAGEGLLRLQRIIRTVERAGHLGACEAELLLSRTKDLSGMLVALAVVMRSETDRYSVRPRLWA